MYDEDELLPLSGLQHLTYCERRFALVHIERAWAENAFTAEGRVLHQRAHSGAVESRPGTLIRRTVPLRSLQLGLSGQADIVEFSPAKEKAMGIRLPGQSGFWQPFPVEYKRRKERTGREAYRIQLCAQAMCLEEMLAVSVPAGAVYDATSRRRAEIAFTDDLRRKAERAAARMHELFQLRRTPAPVYGKHCEKCSLQGLCQPRALTKWSSVDEYLEIALAKSSL